MFKYIVKRILYLIPTIIGVSFIVFLLLYLSPGDAAIYKAGPEASDAEVQVLRESMGLADPFPVQYGRFLKGFVTEFDLGDSYVTGRSVSKTLLKVFPNTLKLTLFALSITIILGIGFGIISALKKNTLTDMIIMVAGLIGLAMPIFWTGLLLILLFSVKIKALPSSGFSSFKHMILPGFALGLQSTAIIMRMTRSSMLEVLNSDYIKTARAKGLKSSRVILIHALKNAMIPVITSLGLQAGGLLGGSVLTETIFSINGIGRMMVDAIKTRDYPIVLGGVIFIAISYAVISIIVDILYTLFDPKMRVKG